MGLRIGYISAGRRGPETIADDLRTAGCEVVKAETGSGRILASILEFIGEGDELVVPSLAHVIDQSPLEILDQLERKHAILYAVHEEFSTRGDGGRALRAVLMAVRPPTQAARLPPRCLNAEIWKLRSAGLGPTEIARRLKISRMTVWRKMRPHGQGQPKVKAPSSIR
ncbi:MAG: hypothetical protein KXJ53_13190 [Phenylobacterium sp.]|jgi:DNA invertase Pin-like site-specific DNA recombinase|nr:hypothetical protein [Phenylobacterium sp.]